MRVLNITRVCGCADSGFIRVAQLAETNAHPNASGARQSRHNLNLAIGIAQLAAPVTTTASSLRTVSG